MLSTPSEKFLSESRHMRRFRFNLRRAAAPLRLAAFGVVLVSACGCTGHDEEPRTSKANHGPSPDSAPGRARLDNPGGSEPLRIAAASDLQAVLPKLADRFQARTALSTSLIFGSSGQLAEQIKGGAPFDVFMAANRAYVRDLVDTGLIVVDSAHPYARGSLVLAVYRGLAAEVSTLQDLAKLEVKKISLANPAFAPYGKAAKQALERAALWRQLEPKIVIAESVRQALVYAQRGDAEAALIGRAISQVPEIKVFDVDPALYDPIIQELGIVTSSQRGEDARRFTRFVLGEDGQRILKEFGFGAAE
jgi:molybdate transport system substrate-binding protein